MGKLKERIPPPPHKALWVWAAGPVGGGVRLGVGVARSSLLPPHPEVTDRVRVQRGAQILRGQVESVLDLLTPSTSKIITIIIMAFGLGAWVLPTHNSIFRVLNCGHLPTY